MPNQDQYIGVINEIIQKQSAILGPDIALAKARSVAGLKLGSDGAVVEISGDGQTVLQELVNSYIELSGEIVRNILNPIFQKYPGVKLDIPSV